MKTLRLSQIPRYTDYPSPNLQLSRIIFKRCSVRVTLIPASRAQVPPSSLLKRKTATCDSASIIALSIVSLFETDFRSLSLPTCLMPSAALNQEYSPRLISNRRSTYCVSTPLMYIRPPSKRHLDYLNTRSCLLASLTRHQPFKNS